MTLRPPNLDLEDALFVERYRISRAALLRRSGGAFLGMTTIGSLLAACGGGDEAEEPDEQAGGGSPAAASGAVSLLCWQGYDDPKAAKPLTQKGVKVKAQYISNNDEIVTKLRGGGVGKFDITTPYHGYIEALVTAELLEPVDLSRIPAAKSYFPQFREPEWASFEGENYAAPLVWGDTPMVYRTDLVKDVPESWLDLRDAKYKGQVVLWDDGFGHILLFSKVLFGPEKPNELTREQLDEVMGVLREIKKNAVTIAPSHGDAADIIARGDGAIQTEGWAYVAQLIKQKGKPAKTHLPKEGAFAWADSYCVVREAPNRDAAYAFINTMVSARGDAIVAGATSSGATNEAAVERLPAAQRELYPYDDLEAYFERLGFYPIPPLEPEGDIMTLKDWNAAWEEFKAA